MCASIYLDAAPDFVRNWIRIVLHADSGYTIRLLHGPTRSRDDKKLYIGIPWEMVPEDVRGWFEQELRIGPGAKLLLRIREHTPQAAREGVQGRYGELRTAGVRATAATMTVAGEFGYTERHVRRLIRKGGAR